MLLSEDIVKKSEGKIHNIISNQIIVPRQDEPLPGPSGIFTSQSNSDEGSDPYEDSSSSYVPSSSSDDEVDTKKTKRRKPKKHLKSTEASEPDSTSTERKLKKRKRKAAKELWQRSIVKQLRLSGKEYVNRKGKQVLQKHAGVVNCSNCRFKCHEKISDMQRETICKQYYSLSDYVRQKVYMSSLMQNTPVSRTKVYPKSTNRLTSRSYYLNDTNGNRQRVCQKFFCSTFAVSHRVIETCAKMMSETGLFTGYDKRKDSRPPNSTPDEAKNLVLDHINLFPKIESHYCRRDSQKHYLSSDLNISIMYRLYRDTFCIEKEIQPVSKFVYQNIFHGIEPPLAFYVPKKDQCFHCNAYNNAKDKAALEEEHQKHKTREDEAMKMKEEDKRQSVADKGKSFRSISFDLQAILSIPHAGDNQIYYKHKLNVYNFTIYDASNADGYCYVWDETHGQKGSIEIGTCLLKYLFALPVTVSHVASFSDTCGGQNRNKYVAAAMLFAVNKIDHLKIIDLKFMESGHSYLEADSMHACIERARRHKKIYSTREWCLLISAARIKRAYIVENLQFTEFFDLKQLVNDIVINTTRNTSNEKVNWLHIKWLRFQKDKPFIIQYKYRLSDLNFLEIDVTSRRRPGRRRTWDSVELIKKYNSRLPVSQKKKQDLIALLTSQIIPNDYSQFINDIPEAKDNTTLQEDGNEDSD